MNAEEILHSLSYIIRVVQMPLQIFPRSGQIYVCDFSGFKIPEMTKKRPVIVVSPKLPFRSQLVSIVPISLTAPKRDLPYVVKLSKNYHPEEDATLISWAKCDMLINLGIYRLNAFKVDRRKYVYPTLSAEDLEAVRKGVLYGLGFGDLLK